VSGETVGQALGRWRRLRGLSFRRLGKLTNYSHVYVWEIETGRKPPSPSLLRRVTIVWSRAVS
jgi:transcriptional regulator with XRE-family HTH domain